VLEVTSGLGVLVGLVVLIGLFERDGRAGEGGTIG
jgi:hypothetical protein